MISRDINNIDYKFFLDDRIIKSVIYKYHRKFSILIIKKKKKKEDMKIKIHLDDSQMR